MAATSTTGVPAADGSSRTTTRRAPRPLLLALSIVGVLALVAVLVLTRPKPLTIDCYRADAADPTLLTVTAIGGSATYDEQVRVVSQDADRVVLAATTRESPGAHTAIGRLVERQVRLTDALGPRPVWAEGGSQPLPVCRR